MKQERFLLTITFILLLCNRYLSLKRPKKLSCHVRYLYKGKAGKLLLLGTTEETETMEEHVSMVKLATISSNSSNEADIKNLFTEKHTRVVYKLYQGVLLEINIQPGDIVIRKKVGKEWGLIKAQH